MALPGLFSYLFVVYKIIQLFYREDVGSIVRYLAVLLKKKKKKKKKKEKSDNHVQAKLNEYVSVHIK